MPLSFYPGKSDQQLLNGLGTMNPEEFCASLTADQEWEFWGWFNSPKIQALMKENVTSTNWVWGYALWMKLNLLMVFIIMMTLKPVPLNGTAPMHMTGWWLTAASIIGIIAPIKVSHWFFWMAYGLITALTFIIAIN